MKYTVNHFDRNNVFGCQGLQLSEPQSRCKMVLWTILHLLTIPFTLLLYPVYVLLCSFINPFYMPREWRWLCFCKELSMRVDRGCFSCLIFLFFLPIVVIAGLMIGVVNLVVFIVPAYVVKIYKLMVMILFWRCFCCLNRHSD